MYFKITKQADQTYIASLCQKQYVFHVKTFAIYFIRIENMLLLSFFRVRLYPTGGDYRLSELSHKKIRFFTFREITISA